MAFHSGLRYGQRKSPPCGGGGGGATVDFLVGGRMMDKFHSQIIICAASEKNSEGVGKFYNLLQTGRKNGILIEGRGGGICGEGAVPKH